MRVSTMREIDRWVGWPVCVGLTGVRKLGDLFGRPAPRPPGRILFVKLAEQGSTVLAQAAIRRAVELVGRENVFFLVLEENRFILDVMGMIPEANVVTIRAEGLVGAFRSALGAVREVRRLGIDAAIDLEFFARSTAALTYLSGAPMRVGFRTFRGEGPGRGDLMTHRMRYNGHLHASQTFRLMVEALEADPSELPTFDRVPEPVEEPRVRFEPDAEEVESAKRLLAEASGVGGFEPLVLLNANASDLLPLRRWESERYVALARRLVETYPEVRVAFTGAPAEAEKASGLVARVGSARCFNLAGKTTLRQLMVVYGLAEVLVTNDSGPAHFASLTPIDTVVLFGPETPKLFAAATPRTHVIWEGLACSPCVSALNDRTSTCRNNLCMQRIDVDRVFERVCGALERRRSESAAPAGG